MAFLSPIWLLGLLPWAGAALYLMSGRRVAVVVPFLALWSGPVTVTKPRRAIHWPPLFILLLLGAMLLGIVAAAGPALRPTLPAGPHLTVLLDRGITMSPTAKNGLPFRGVIALAREAVGRRFGRVPIEFVAVPGETVQTNATDWAVLAERLAPTALDNTGLLPGIVAEHLRQSQTGLVIVLSDQNLQVAEDRLVQIAPDAGVTDVGIASISARISPMPQLMVRLRNSSSQRTSVLHVMSDAGKMDRQVELPPAGLARDFFIDLPKSPGPIISGSIDSNDSAPLNDRAWLARQPQWPVIETSAPLPAPVQRMIEVYSKSRPAQIGSVQVVVSTHALSDTKTGVWIIPGNGSAPGPAVPVVASHPITQHVAHWPAAADPAAVPPPRFAALLIQNGKPLLAMRDQPARQVWVNLDTDSWASSPDLVIFFTNLFDWLGVTGGNAFTAQPCAQLGPEWIPDNPVAIGVPNGLWPGVYRRSDGAILAVNAPDVIWHSPPRTSGLARLDRQAAQTLQRISLSPALCLIAIGLAAAAMFYWPAMGNRR